MVYATARLQGLCIVRMACAAAQSLANVFRVMEGARASLGVSAYGVSMPTLEQVFLSVAGLDLQA